MASKTAAGRADADLRVEAASADGVQREIKNGTPARAADGTPALAVPPGANH